jgi:hypothetical protein|tara:strand:+ start:1608 stop:1850 length:243 start_codon:yes stop_codon:yes gene_type:complete
MANPYELRYSIYQEAQHRLMDRFHNDHDMWFQFEEWKREQELEGAKVTAKSPVSLRPEFPTHEQILVEAEKIYEFVQKKS